VNEPDVVLTDLGLAVLAAYLARRLWTGTAGSPLPKIGAVLLSALASAAFWGAIFHAFFPAKTATIPGFIAWMPVVFSIVVAAVAMLELSLRILVSGMSPRVRRSVVVVYTAGFVAVVLLVDESFTSIVRFYVPALVLLLLAAAYRAANTRSAGWIMIAGGLLLSAGAAVLQQARILIHPVYFDHNAVYHVVQGVAVVFLYLGFRRAPEASANHYATGSAQAFRQG
jgi:hypothetical protein